MNIRCRSTTRGLLAAACLAALPGAGWSDGHEWKLEAADARCLFAGLDRLQNSAADPVIIFLEACKDPEVATAGVFHLLNPQLRETPAGDVDKVIVYTKAELACLERPLSLLGNAVVTLPKRPECPR